MTKALQFTPLRITVIAIGLCTLCSIGCSTVLNYSASSTHKMYVQQKEKEKADKASRDALLTAARKVIDNHSRINQANKVRKDTYSDVELIEEATRISIADLQDRINMQGYSQSVMSGIHLRVTDIIRLPNGKDGERFYSAVVVITNMHPGAISKIAAVVTGVPLDGHSPTWSGYVYAGTGKEIYIGANTSKKVVLPLIDPMDGNKGRFDRISSKKGWQSAPFPSLDSVHVASTVTKIYDSIMDHRLESVSKSNSSDVDSFLVLKKYKH